MSLLVLFNQQTTTSQPIDINAGLFYTTDQSIDINAGLFYDTSITNITNNSGVFYSVDISNITTTNGLYYDRFIQQDININKGVYFDVFVSSTPVYTNKGLFWEKFTPTTITVNKGLFFDRFTPIDITINKGVFYLNNFQLFSFMQDFIYKESDLLLAVNKCANTATSMYVTIQTYNLDYDLYEQFGYADHVVVDIEPLKDILNDPETITITLSGPITISSNTVITHDLTESRDIEYSPYAESYTSQPIEIRDSSDKLVTGTEINFTTDTLNYTTDTYTLWYGRYYSEDLRSPVFVRLYELVDGVSVTLTINGREYVLSTALTQLPIFTPDSSDIFTITVTTNENFTETTTNVQLEFYTMSGSLTSTLASSQNISSQDVCAAFNPDYTFNISIFHSTTTSLLRALGIGAFEDMHI